MEKRQYELVDQARAYSRYRQIHPPGLLKLIINFLSKEISPPFETAVDVGCGSGQSTVILAPYFQSVLGCDVSKAQIRESLPEKKFMNVKYMVCPAESLPVPDQSVHLLTAATCFHWLDQKSFFKEAKRVLVDGGVLAVYSSRAIYPVTGDAENDVILKQLTDKVLYEDMEMYRSPCVHQLFQEYENVYFPFQEVVRMRDICHTYIATAADAAGHIRSMSTFQNFRKVHPQRAEYMLEEYQNRIMEILGMDCTPESTPVKYQRNYVLIMCRKSNGTTNDTEPSMKEQDIS